MIRIGREALRCLLARRGVTFQRPRTWKESLDFDRAARLDRIEEVLDRFPDRVFALDEFGPLGIRPTAGSCWAARKHPDRLPAAYHLTGGVRYFHGCYCIGDDTLWGVNRRKKGGAPNALAALKSIRAARPDGALGGENLPGVPEAARPAPWSQATRPRFTLELNANSA